MSSALPPLPSIVALNPENFRALIRRHGEPCLWQRAMPCNCTSSESAEDTEPCGECEQGFRYTNMVLDAAVRVFIDKTTRGFVDAEMGPIAKGTTTVAAMPDELGLSFADKLILPRRVAWHKAVYNRGSGDTDTLKRTPALSIKQVQRVEPATGEVTLYVPGVDYRLEGNAIEWLSGGSSPAAGQSYSLLHSYKVTYWFLGEFKQEAPPSQFGGQLLPLLGALDVKHPFDGQT